MMSDSSYPAIAERALEYVADGTVIGLGSGRASAAFVRALAARVQAGLRVRGVPTSVGTAELARELGVPLTTLQEAMPLDVAIDGADEVDPQCNLIKGLGGALVRERIVAAAARQFIVLVGPDKVREKVVPALGSRGTLPVEVIPFGLAVCRQRLGELTRCNLGLTAVPDPRSMNGQVFITDNSNYILDCPVTAIPEPVKLEQAILAIPGVVDTGLFLGMADVVLIQNGEKVETRTVSKMNG
jgi:ribose 5-phosphate isomerase A